MVGIDLSGRVALVTGAGGGIGFATIERLLLAGATVVGNVRELRPEVQDRFEGLRATYAERFSVSQGSVSSAAYVETLAKQIFSMHRRLDVLVNNAGILRDAYIGMISEAQITEVLQVNLASVIMMTQAMSRLMKRNKSGSIINLASIMGVRGNVAQLVYASSKAGVIGATLSASKELASAGIRVNAVAPGFIETPMTSGLPEEAREDLLARIGLGRAGTPEDVADVVILLASDLTRYVTGQVVGVDGGMIV
jgi:3-oxoacyl-[acyl-carrier protein] reductase